MFTLIKKKVVAFLAIVTCLSVIPAPISVDASEQKITEAYLACLGRYPEPEGMAFWLTQPGAPTKICAAPESPYAGTAQSVNAAYARCLGRYPDLSGFFFWAIRPDHVNGICLSDEAKQFQGIPGDWILLGSGKVWGPPVLRHIAACESGHGVVGSENYAIMNGSGSSAAGAYQFLSGTWRAVLGEMGVSGPGSAIHASPELQDRAAVALATQISWGGVHHWNPSRHCWR